MLEKLTLKPEADFGHCLKLLQSFPSGGEPGAIDLQDLLFLASEIRHREKDVTHKKLAIAWKEAEEKRDKEIYMLKKRKLRFSNLSPPCYLF